MKHLKVALLALLLISGFNNMNAQDKNNTWAFGVGINAVDFYPTNSGLDGQGAWFDEYANTTDHYNILPSLSRITVSKYLTDGYSIEAAGSLNRITKVGDNATSEKTYYGLDGAVKYDLNKVIGDTSFFNPYASVGGGYVWLDNSGTATFNGAFGVNFWFSESVGLNIESKYKHSFGNSITQHFQHALGIVVKFGGTDSDNDGIYDKFDACPEVFGLAEYKGCPDSDSDGIIDSKDACPNTAGLATLNGCPDADEDGIADKDDACPNNKGSKANNGCPDTDADGLVDKDDACPNVAGPTENKGCPWSDTDGDGVLDKDDTCVNVAGPASNNGCPEISSVEIAKLEELFKTVYFDSGKNTFGDATTSKLNEAAQIMAKFITVKFDISGHTDNTGSKKRNQELSENRANAVKDYLINKGVSSSNLIAKGFGEDMPIASNYTRSGRSQNRRVEVKLGN